MAIDEVLANRIRGALSSTDGVAEKAMFGGICWMLNGNMALGLTNKGDLMVRVGPEAHQWALGQPGAKPMDFAGRPMVGMVFIDGTGHATEDDLTRWAGLALTYVASLPPKDSSKKPPRVKTAAKPKAKAKKPAAQPKQTQKPKAKPVAKPKAKPAAKKAKPRKPVAKPKKKPAKKRR